MATITKTSDEYLKEPYARILVPAEEGGFSAEILEFPGCIAEGETADEALQNLERTGQAWIEAALDQGQQIPAPSSSLSFSGKLALRLPRGLHKQAVRMAARDGVSLNQFLLSAIAARVGAEDFYERLVQRLSMGNTIVFAFNAANATAILALTRGHQRRALKFGARGDSVGTGPESISLANIGSSVR